MLSSDDLMSMAKKRHQEEGRDGNERERDRCKENKCSGTLEAVKEIMNNARATEFL